LRKTILSILALTVLSASVMAAASGTDFRFVQNGQKHVKTKGFSFGTATELTCSNAATASITVVQTYHTIDTFNDLATSNLQTISGGVVGQELILQSVNATHDVTLKDGTDNLQLGGDITLGDTTDLIKLFYDGTNWLRQFNADN